MIAMASRPSTTKQLRLCIVKDDKRTALDISGPQVLFEEGLLKEWEENELCLETLGTPDVELMISDETVEKKISQIRTEGPQIHCTTTWRWNPKGRVGYHSLVLRDAKSKASVLDTQCYITPSSIDRTNYDQMLAWIRKICYSLIYDFYKSAFEFVKEEEVHGLADAQELFKKIEKDLGQIEKILARMARNPHKALTRLSKPESAFTSRRPDGRQLHKLVQHPEKFIPYGDEQKSDRHLLISRVPLEIPALSVVETYDVQENRLLKHFVEHVLNEQIGLVRQAAAKEIERIRQNRFQHPPDDHKIRDLEEVTARCEQFRQQISLIHRNYRFLGEAGRLKTTKTMSLVLQRERNYREFYKLYLAFMRKRARLIYSDSFFLTIKAIQELYEMWCLLRIIELCRELGFRIVRQNLFQAEELRFTYRLSAGAEPVLTMRKGRSDLEVLYRKEYSHASLKSVGYGSRGESHIPDIALELFRSGEAAIPRVLVFDAKYRKYTPEIVNRLAAYMNDIGDLQRSIVFGAAALWIDDSAEYRSYQLPAKTGGFYFVPSADFFGVKRILTEFTTS